MAIITVKCSQINSVESCPHIVEIRQAGSTTLLKQIYCKTEDTDITAEEFSLTEGSYDIKIINPNLYSSSVTTFLRHWDVNLGYYVNYVPSFTVQAGHYDIKTIDITSEGLLIDTNNNASANPSILYRVIGVESSRITTGSTLDGTVIQLGKQYYQRIKFVDINTSIDSGLEIDNKKLWSYQGANIDTLGVIPYIDISNIVITSLDSPVITIDINPSDNGTNVTLTNNTIYQQGVIIKFYEKIENNYILLNSGSNTYTFPSIKDKVYVAKAFNGNISSDYSNEITIDINCSFNITSIVPSNSFYNHYIVNFTSTIVDQTSLTYIIKNSTTNSILKTQILLVNTSYFIIDLSDISISNIYIEAYFDIDCKGSKTFTHNYIPSTGEQSLPPSVLNLNIPSSQTPVSFYMFRGCPNALIKIFKNGLLIQEVNLDNNGNYQYNGILIQGEEFNAKQICSNKTESNLSTTLIIAHEEDTKKLFLISSLYNSCNKVLEFGISNTNNPNTVSIWNLQQNSIIPLEIGEIKYIFARNKYDINDISLGLKIE